MLNPFTHRKVLKKGIPGRATIVAASTPARGATSFNMAMTLQVHAEGLTPYEVEDQWMVKAKDTEALHGSIPVKVDRDEPDKVAIDWDALREEHEQHKQRRRDALASGGVTSFTGGPEILTQLGAVIEAAMQQPGTSGFDMTSPQASPAPATDDDDTVSRLERLAKLRDAGVVTDAEFEQAKRRVLEGD